MGGKEEKVGCQGFRYRGRDGGDEGAGRLGGKRIPRVSISGRETGALFDRGAGERLQV